MEPDRLTIEDLLDQQFDRGFGDRVGSLTQQSRRRAAGIPVDAAGPWDEPLELAAEARRIARQFDALAVA